MTDLDAIIRQCWEDSGQWFPVNTNTQMGSDNQISFLMLALAGEVGEAANVWKKYLRGSKPLSQTTDPLREELIDVLIYWCNLAYVLGINVEEEYARKRAYNRTRFDRNARFRTGGPSDHGPADQEDPS